MDTEAHPTRREKVIAALRRPGTWPIPLLIGASWVAVTLMIVPFLQSIETIGDFLSPIFFLTPLFFGFATIVFCLLYTYKSIRGRTSLYTQIVAWLTITFFTLLTAYLFATGSEQCLGLFGASTSCGGEHLFMLMLLLLFNPIANFFGGIFMISGIITLLLKTQKTH